MTMTIPLPDPVPTPVRQAVILCGGKGERLGEITRRVPKPLLPVGGRPVLDHILDNLESAGIRRFVLSAGYLGSRSATTTNRPVGVPAPPSTR
jgi:NDP-sugar pyrophosphorylase family protein